jgi:hypothetical protein
MANPYFRQLPSFEYVNRLPDSKLGDYIEVKNLFKRAYLRPDIFQNITFFEKYKIIGNDRPDNVAYEVYNDSTLDWVVLLSNNITNIQSEWPLTQTSFDTYLKEKYGVGLDTEVEIYNRIYNEPHHWETIEIKNSQGVTIIPAGLEVPFNYGLGLKYYDEFTQEKEVLVTNATIPVTNYEYEEKLEDAKRNIYVLKPRYLNIIFSDMEEMMAYKEGSSQYKTETLKTADNIRLYS